MQHALLFFFSCCCSFCMAQTNLVPNGSFEEYTDCPNSYPDLDGKCNNWTTFRGTPDYFHNCSAFCGYDNARGYQTPRTGYAYTGVVSYVETSIPNGREQLGAELLYPLDIGVRYYVSFYVSCGLANGISIASNKIGAKFTTYQYNDTNGTESLSNSCHIYTNKIITDTLNWVQISGSFVADSAYRYIIIGGFFDDMNIDTLMLASVNPVGQASFYYVEDICVSTDALLCEVTPHTNISFVMPSAFSPNSDGMNDVYALMPSSTVVEIFRVYNRWGQKIYEESGLNVGWDGNYKGEPQPTDVYGYYIEVKNDVSGEVEKRTGSFMLLR